VKLFFEDYVQFQHVWSQSTNVTDWRTDIRHTTAKPRFSIVR